ncbi:MAG TPA: hypothetical protein VI248_13450 [Kineosporiaceae bacterium]
MNAAWRSLARAETEQLHAGDTVLFRRGCTWEGNLTLRTGGTPQRKLIVTAYGDGSRPVLTLPSDSAHEAIVDMFADNIILSSLKLAGARAAGVHIHAGASDNAVEDVEVTSSGFGVQIEGDHNLISHTNAHDLRIIRSTPGGDDDFGAVGYVISGVGNEVAYSRCVRCRAPSDDYGTDGGFVEIWNSGDDTYVHHNYSTDNAGFFELGGENLAHHANNVRVAYNIIEDSGGSLDVHTQGKFALIVTGLRFENNTVIQSRKSEPQLIFFGSTRASLAVRNNIFFLTGPGLTVWLGSGDFDRSHNLYYTSNGASVGLPLLRSETHADPQFVSPETGDFRLRATSPAKDAGIPLGYSIDFNGDPLPDPSDPSIGALNPVS